MQMPEAVKVASWRDLGLRWLDPLPQASPDHGSKRLPTKQRSVQSSYSRSLRAISHLRDIGLSAEDRCAVLATLRHLSE